MITFLNEVKGNSPVMSNLRDSIVLLVALLVVSGCAQNTRQTTDGNSSQPEDYVEGLRAPEGFVRKAVPEGGVIYVREGATGLGGYDSMGPLEISFEYANRQRGISANEKSRIQQILADFRSRYDQGGVGEFVSDEPGPCVLNSKLYVRELDLYRSPHGGSQVSYVRSLGSMIIVNELSDSVTGEVYALYSYKVGLGSGQVNNKGADLVRLQSVMDQTLNELTSRFGPLLPWSPIDSREQFGCSGRLGNNLPPSWRQPG